MLPHNLPPEFEPEVQSETTSAMHELQGALGSLLIVPQHKSSITTLAIFTLPRELRDTIYYHYLYRPQGIVCGSHRAPIFPLDQSESDTNLFLASRQVYDEGLQVFYRCNTIHFGSRKHEYDWKLRLFPDRPKQLLRQAKINYFESKAMYRRRSPARSFIHMIRDAYTFKFLFPKLLTFTVEWYAWRQYFSDQGLIFKDKGKEENVQIWLEWVREAIKMGGSVVPPRWLSFQFGSELNRTEMTPFEEDLNEAYRAHVKQTTTFIDEEKELEESGRKWLEETWRKGGKNKRRGIRHS